MEACVFTSARTLERARNVALFEPAFATSRPRNLQGWTCYATRHRVEFTRNNTFTPATRLSPGAVRGGGRAADPGTLRGGALRCD